MQNLKFKNQKESAKRQEPKYKDDLKRRVYRFVLRVMKLIDVLPKNMSCEVIGRQLLRSSTSIGANISEARASSSRKDFINFITYSLKSANETFFWLNLLKDSGKVSQLDLGSVVEESDQIARILGASIITLKQKSDNF